MEDNTAQNNVGETQTPEIPSFDQGGSVGSSSLLKFSFIEIFMLGLSTASLIYSIHYYRLKLNQRQNSEMREISKISSDVQKLKKQLEKVESTNRTKNGNIF